MQTERLIIVDRRVSGGTIVFCLFLTFMILKLTHNIAWSWWWVTAPLWIPFALLALVIPIIVIIAIVRD